MDENESGPGAVSVAPSGAIDLATADALYAMIVDAVGTGAAAVVVDLSGVDFMDSSGLRSLVKGRQLASARGALLSVTGAGGMVREVLEMTGLAAHLGTPPQV